MAGWPEPEDRQATTFGGLTRSEVMSRVRSSRNKTTELRMVGLLRRAKLRGWRRHADILGRPDFTWRRDRVVLFVDGCFWHGHDCGRNLKPKTNAELWANKIQKTVERDQRTNRELSALGWKVVRVWECELVKDPKGCVRRIQEALQGY